MRLYLGHGAGGTAASMAAHVRGLQARGVETFAVDLPRRGAFPVRAENAVGAFLAESGAGEGVAVGGHSYGGRVASLLAATERFAALVLFSYPLHPPRRPALEARIGHWPRIRCPVLLISGESDEFAQIELLRRAVMRLPDARLVTYPRIGHDLARHLEPALDEAAAFLREVGG